MPITSNFIWTWMNGNGNTPSPVPRSGPTVWTGLDGLLYLFGGNPNSSPFFNDLWRYDPNSNQWTQIRATNGSDNSIGASIGSDSSNNWPAIRADATGWVGTDGLFYLFGGQKDITTYWNDMWRYNPTSGLWAFLGGSLTPNQSDSYTGNTVYPGSRYRSAGTTGPDGLVYLFGGSNSLGSFNNLWSFNTATYTWNFIKGGQTPNQPGVYGATPNDNNLPGAREGAFMWTGKDNSLYVSCGITLNSQYCNDVWKFNFSTKQWVWLNGASDFNKVGTFNALHTLDKNNSPGSRSSGTGWQTSNGNFFIFAGDSYTVQQGRGFLNDLWMYDVPSNQWALLKGSTALNNSGSFGAITVPSDSNLPPSRLSSVGWKSNNDTLYLFGGLGAGGATPLNDLWRGTMPCDFSISDAFLFPQVITAGQSFNVAWTLKPSIFPLNYQGIVTFKGSDYTKTYTSSTASLSLPGQPTGVYSDLKLKLVSLNMLGCSDSRNLSLSIIDANTASLLLAFLPTTLVILLLGYIGFLGLFLVQQYGL